MASNPGENIGDSTRIANDEQPWRSLWRKPSRTTSNQTLNGTNYETVLAPFLWPLLSDDTVGRGRIQMKGRRAIEIMAFGIGLENTTGRLYISRVVPADPNKLVEGGDVDAAYTDTITTQPLLLDVSFTLGALTGIDGEKSGLDIESDVRFAKTTVVNKDNTWGTLTHSDTGGPQAAQLREIDGLSTIQFDAGASPFLNVYMSIDTSATEVGLFYRQV